MSEAQQIRFRVKVKRPEETREYLVVMDLQTLQDEAIGYPLVRAAEGIKLNFLVDVQQDQFVEISEEEMSKMQLRSVPSSRHDMGLWEILS
jgi:hypothetical protein